MSETIQRDMANETHEQYMARYAAWRREKMSPEMLASEQAVRDMHERLREAGCEYLIGAKIGRSRKGGVTYERKGRVSFLSHRECELLGRTPGHGND